MQEIKEIKHIKEEMWISLKNNSISPEQYMQILEHSCQCTGCADRLAAVMDPGNVTDLNPEPIIILPPAYLSEEILERTKQADVRAAAAVKQSSKKMQLLMYSLRVGAAVMASIFILTVTSRFQDMDYSGQLSSERPAWSESQQEESFLDKVNQAANGLTGKVNEFTNQLLKGGKKE